jgi:protein tyrosine phosphatase
MKVTDFLQPKSQQKFLRVFSFGVTPKDYSIKIALLPLPTQIIEQKSLTDFFDELSSLGFRKILSLCSDDAPLIKKDWEKRSFHKIIELFIEDFAAPSYSQFLKAYEEIKKSIALKENILIHCLAGYGRSGSILTGIVLQTIYDYYKKLPHPILNELISVIRTLDAHNEQSVESFDQFNALEKLETNLQEQN